MGLFNTITNITNDTLDSQLQTMTGIIKTYYNGACTVETDDGVMENVKCVNIPKIGSECILMPVDEEYQCIPNEIDDTSTIYAMGLGKFSINNEGDLLFELPIGSTNYMSINNNGDLIVNLDNETNAKFKIDDNGDLTYGSV